MCHEYDNFQFFRDSLYEPGPDARYITGTNFTFKHYGFGFNISGKRNGLSFTDDGNWNFFYNHNNGAIAGCDSDNISNTNGFLNGSWYYLNTAGFNVGSS